MDVSKALGLICLLFLIANCDQAPESGNTRFDKSTDERCEENQLSGQFLVRWKSGKVTVENADSQNDFIDGFMEDHADEIVSAEPHYKVFVEPKNFAQQSGFGGDVNWGVSATEASSGWGKSSLSEPIVVAVIDSGVKIDHPELQGMIYQNPNEIVNGLDDDGNGLIDDVNGWDFYNNQGDVVDYTGHGTHVAGVIAARHDVGQVYGMAPDSLILPLGFLGGEGSGTIDAAIRAINYAADQGAKVINASWGGNACSVILRETIRGLAGKNILFVSAAGNSGSNIDITPEYPAAFPLDNHITVGASTFDSKTAGFSNFGSLVDLVAPGANIISTYPPEFEKENEVLVPEQESGFEPDGVTPLNGTSMAAPFVSAAAALLWSAKPDASYVEIKQALLMGVVSGPYPVSTRGQLNVRQSLDYISR